MSAKVTEVIYDGCTNRMLWLDGAMTPRQHIDLLISQSTTEVALADAAIRAVSVRSKVKLYNFR